MRHLGRSEAALDGGDYQIADHLTGDTGLRDRRPGDDLAVAGIQYDEDTDLLAISGMDLQMVRAPAHVRAKRDDDAVMGAARTMRGMAFQRQARCCMIRSTRLALTLGRPAARRSRLRRAVTRR